MTKKTNRLIKFLLPGILFLLFSGLTMAQELNRTDQQGLKQGRWVKKYSNGAIRYEGFFVDGQPEGLFKYYYPTGQIKAITTYSDGGKIARTKTFQINGKPLAEGKYVNRKRDSLWVFYSDQTGKKIAEKNYKNGILDGKSIIRFPETGKVMRITRYKNGLKNGKTETFFTDGKPSRLETYVNDTLNGPFKVWFPGGGIEIEGAYKNGYQDGLWITYDKNGKIIKKERFEAGVVK